MNRSPDIRTEEQARRSFWIDTHPRIRARYVPGRRQNAYPADVRMAWVAWVDFATRDGRMTEALASKVTL